MEAVEKARELKQDYLKILSKYNNIERYMAEQVRELVTRCVDEIIKGLDEQEHSETGKVLNSFGQKYWIEVKSQI